LGDNHPLAKKGAARLFVRERKGLVVQVLGQKRITRTRVSKATTDSSSKREGNAPP